MSLAQKSIFVFILCLLISNTAEAAPYPTIFVHGIGDSSVVWKKTGPAVSTYLEKYYKTPDHPYFTSGSGIGSDGSDRDFSDNIRNSCIYITFADRFASPDEQVPELAKLIKETREETGKRKVNLVAFSMGGLVARKYLAKNLDRHHVNKLIMISTPHRGSTGLTLNYIPLILEIGGVSTFLLTGGNPISFGVALTGLAIEGESYRRGVQLISPAVEAMKPDSAFLKDLNSHEMPTDVQYISIIGDTTHFPDWMVNQILFYPSGDGAISVKSQRLIKSGIPNAEKLNYKEFYIDCSHFECAKEATEVVIEALELEED